MSERASVSNQHKDPTRDMRCPNCQRVVVEHVNYHNSLGTCVFCDLNRNGVDP